jgi:hypothetical protein
MHKSGGVNIILTGLPVVYHRTVDYDSLIPIFKRLTIFSEYLRIMMRRNSARQHTSSNASWTEDVGNANVMTRRSSTTSTVEEGKERIFMGDSVEGLLRSLRTQEFCGKLDPAQHSTHLEWTMQTPERRPTALQDQEDQTGARRLIGNKRNRQSEFMANVVVETSESESNSHYNASHYHQRYEKQNSLPLYISIPLSTSTTPSDDETDQ